MIWARGYLSRKPAPDGKWTPRWELHPGWIDAPHAEDHTCAPGRLQTVLMHPLEFDEWTCIRCGRRWVYRFRKATTEDDDG